MKSILCIMLTIFLSASLMMPIAAAQAKNPHYPIGQIAHIEGSAYSVKGDNRKQLEQGDPVYLNSTIHTNDKSKLMLLFIDDTRVSLGEEAELFIDEFVFDPYDSSENKAELSVKQGAFYWISGMISKRENPEVTINNSFGSIGIRGTAFWGGEIQEGYGVLVDDGLVVFSGDWGSAELPKGASTFITKASAVQGETFWSPENKAIAQKTVTFKMAKELDKKLTDLFRENIRKRHDYRGQMFPYKENPFRPKVIPKEEDDEFFSDEFKELQDKKK